MKKLGIKNLSIFTPYTSEINDSVAEFFNKENFKINDMNYFDIASDLDIGKVDSNHLFSVLKKIDLSKSDALFVSCTALPVLSLINDLEKELNKPVISSNQALIWDCLELINSNYNIEGFGRLFKN